MANTINCPACGSAAVVLLWEEDNVLKVGLWCDFCGSDVEGPPWLRLEVKEDASGG